MKICKECIAINIVTYFAKLYGQEVTMDERRGQQADIVKLISDGIDKKVIDNSPDPSEIEVITTKTIVSADGKTKIKNGERSWQE